LPTAAAAYAASQALDYLQRCGHCCYLQLLLRLALQLLHVEQQTCLHAQQLQQMLP
jgi:hypothetical protein